MGEELIRRALTDEARCAPEPHGLWVRMRLRVTRCRRRRAVRTGLGIAGAVVLAVGVGLWCRRRRVARADGPRAG